MQNILQVKITYDKTLTPRERHVFSNDTNIFAANAKTPTAEFSDTEALAKKCFVQPQKQM